MPTFFHRLSVKLSIAAFVFIFTLAGATTALVSTGFRRTQFNAYFRSAESLEARGRAALLQFVELEAELIAAQIDRQAAPSQAWGVGEVNAPAIIEGLVEIQDGLHPTPGTVSFLVLPDGRLAAVSAPATDLFAAARPGEPAQWALPGLDLNPAVPPLRAALEGARAGRSGIEKGAIAGDPYFVAYAPLPEISWSLILVAPEGEVIAQSGDAALEIWRDAEATIQRTLLLMGGFFLAALAGTLALSRRLLTRPIVDLLKGVRAVTAGDLNVTIPVDSEDELGLLAASFNQMAGELKRRNAELVSANASLAESQQDLEKRVQEATVEIVQLYEQAEQRSLELEALYRADEQLHRHLRLDQVLQAIVDVVVDILHADKASVQVWDAASGRLVVRAVRGYSPAGLASLAAFTPDEGIAGRVFLSGEVLAVEDALQAPPPADRIAQVEGIRSILSVPIKVGGQVFGVFGMDYARPRTFSAQDQRLFSALAQRAAAAIENAHLYEQAEQAATLEERQRLARELHDSVTQSLYSLVLLAEAGRRLAGAGDLEQVERHLKRLGETSRQALQEMRLMVYEMRPLALQEVGFVQALQQRLEAVEKRAGIQAHLQIEGPLDLPAPIEAGLYRIAVEALNNSLKHAGAAAVSVRIQSTPADLRLEIADNGRGFAAAELLEGGGFGLSSMRERAERLGASLEIDSVSGKGTTLRLQVPKEAAEWKTVQTVRSAS